DFALSRRGGSRRHRLGRVAVGSQERDDVGAVFRLGQGGKGHLGARRELLGVGQPGAQVLPIPTAALARQRLGEGEAVALADRLARNAPQVGAERVGSALVGVGGGG